MNIPIDQKRFVLGREERKSFITTVPNRTFVHYSDYEGHHANIPAYISVKRAFLRYGDGAVGYVHEFGNTEYIKKLAQSSKNRIIL